MRLVKLGLNNFRRYESAKFQFHPQFTVLIGDNGKGKTTILDAIAVMLGTYFQGSGITTGQSVIKKSDARLVLREKEGQFFLEPKREVFLDAIAIIQNQEIQWRRDVGDRGGKAKELIEIGNQDRYDISEGKSPDLPLLLYYGSRRLWSIHREVQIEKPGSQLDAYRFCLDPKSDQKAFEKWYKNLTFSALQRGIKSPALKVIQETVMTCIPNAIEFYHDVTEDQIMIKLEGEGLIPFNNLSDGYRNMVATVADIVHRAARLNPHFGEEVAKQTKGVVLIDEIDLHLHPKWQRHVVFDLRKAFPNLQFIATTHSPFILQSLQPGEVIDLNQSLDSLTADFAPADVASPGPGDSYSNRSIEDIVEEIMGVPIPQRSQRYQAMYEAAQEYYRVLQESQNVSEAEKNRLKQQLDRLSAPFSDNVAYHAFLEMERLAAGLGSSNQGAEA